MKAVKVAASQHLGVRRIRKMLKPILEDQFYRELYYRICEGVEQYESSCSDEQR